VVRATGIEGLAGTRAPVTGLLDLRGTPVPVVDLRSDADPGSTGDVLVLTTTEGVLGLAVDRVVSVVGPEDLLPPAADEPLPHGLPSYVVEVRRDATARAVLVVSLPALAGLVSA
jgi:purine-binding chemotaxis protein CheW